MIYEWDAEKNAANIAKHGVDFSAAERLDWDTAEIFEDARRSYGEQRLSAIGTIDGRLHVLVYTKRGPKRRIISLRKANAREQERYNG